MAKDKEFEEKYKIERLKRKIIRKAARNLLKKSNYRYRTKECPKCGGRMIWCSSCEVWTQTCCEKYGTCMCS